MFVFIGFSSWLMIPIRSNANTVINENAPSDARALLAYYNLEQYPDTHIFYGPMYSDAYAGQDPEEPYKDDKPKYEKDLKLNKYIIVNDWEDGKINSNSNHIGLLPRMWSSDHASNYMKYFGYLPFTIKPEYKSEDESEVEEYDYDGESEFDSDKGEDKEDTPEQKEPENTTELKNDKKLKEFEHVSHPIPVETIRDVETHEKKNNTSQEKIKKGEKRTLLTNNKLKKVTKQTLFK